MSQQITSTRRIILLIFLLVSPMDSSPDYSTSQPKIIRHLKSRLVNYVILGAQIQHVSLAMGVSRAKILTLGCSPPIDGSVQIVCLQLNGEVEEGIGKIFTDFLEKSISRTNDIHGYENLPIVSKINQLQSEFLTTLSTIDFSLVNTREEDKLKILAIKRAFLDAGEEQIQQLQEEIDQQIYPDQTEKYKDQIKFSNLIMAFYKLTKLNEEDLFRQAREEIQYVSKPPKISYWLFISIVILFVVLVFRN